jgi:dTDP-glucose 4,6-dehydratase
MVILVTGGAGFIGANFLRKHVPRFPEHTFVNVDALTYAGNPLSLAAVAECANYAFEHRDITDPEAVRAVFESWKPDAVVHFAAESHVDRSLLGPGAFVLTNVVGTFNLLDCGRNHWAPKAAAEQGAREGEPGHQRFHHVSTDEVYGSLGDDGKFRETTAYDPSSPYSASKAGSDHLVRAYHRSYGLNVTITNCSNNYGPRQFPEKLIPLMILNALEGKALPVYGKGANIRDWLYVDDHSEAIWEVFTKAPAGATYNVGGDCEMRNIDVVEMICDIVEEQCRNPAAPDAFHPLKTHPRELITFVKDRPGHDFRYAMDISKIGRDLNWTPKETFDSGIRKTVQWYMENPEWVEAVRSGEYRNWLQANYDNRQ